MEKGCRKCGELFLIIAEEREFYEEKGLPFPSNCPLCRQKDRLSRRSEQKFYGTVCDECGKEIIVAFEPPDEQKVFCKNCYLDYFEKTDAMIN